jgi:hypothetical protein
MPSKTRDTRTRAHLLSNAYVEALVGVFALRLPTVDNVVKAHAPQMSVGSSYDGEDLILDADAVVSDLAFSGEKIKTTVDQITVAFVAAMWDTLMSHARYDAISTKPDILFFRHLRNACGHDGRWNFKDLKHPAKWRDKELTMSHVGSLVFGGLLKHGDVALLFGDIDKKYFEQ